MGVKFHADSESGLLSYDSMIASLRIAKTPDVLEVRPKKKSWSTPFSILVLLVVIFVLQFLPTFLVAIGSGASIRRFGPGGSAGGRRVRTSNADSTRLGPDTRPDVTKVDPRSALASA